MALSLRYVLLPCVSQWLTCSPIRCPGGRSLAPSTWGGAWRGGPGRVGAGMTSAAKSPYAGYRFPGEVISHAVWLYFRFPLSLRMVEEMLAARGIEVSHETVRQWACMVPG